MIKSNIESPFSVKCDFPQAHCPLVNGVGVEGEREGGKRYEVASWWEFSDVNLCDDDADVEVAAALSVCFAAAAVELCNRIPARLLARLRIF